MKKRVEGLDVLKALCAFFVVCIHRNFGVSFSGKIYPFFEVAVPIFFMITGFFYVDTINKKKEWTQIKKIFLLFLSSSVLFCFFKLFFAFYNGNVMEYISNTYNLKNFIKLILFNDSMIEWHLWYLSAVLYVLVTCWGLRKITNKWDKILFVFTPFLLLACFMMEGYYNLHLGKKIPFILFRNFLFMGLPYFSIGLFIRKHQDNKLISYLKNNMLVCSFFVFFFMIAIIVERALIDGVNCGIQKYNFLGTIFLAIFTFILFLNEKWGVKEEEKKLEQVKLRFIKKIGREYSSFIYIFHIIILIIYDKLNLGDNFYVIRLFGPVWIFMASVGCAWVYFKVKAWLSERICKFGTCPQNGDRSQSGDRS